MHVQGLLEDADINSEDPEVVERGLALLEDAVTTTHAFGGKYMVGVLMSALKKYPGPCSTAARKNVVASLKVRPSLLLALKKYPGSCSTAARKNVVASLKVRPSVVYRYASKHFILFFLYCGHSATIQRQTPLFEENAT
jgi:hypothetical protein